MARLRYAGLAYNDRAHRFSFSQVFDTSMPSGSDLAVKECEFDLFTRKWLKETNNPGYINTNRMAHIELLLVEEIDEAGNILKAHRVK